MLYARIEIAKVLNLKSISLDYAPKGCAAFARGVAWKFVINLRNFILDVKQTRVQEETAAA